MQGREAAQPRRGKQQPRTEGEAAQQAPTGRRRECGQPDGPDPVDREEEQRHRREEQAAVGEDEQQRGGDHRADGVLEFVRDSRLRQRARVVVRIGQEMRDQRLVGGRECGGGGGEDEHRQIEMPEVGGEWQRQNRGGAQQVEADQERTLRQPPGQRRGDRRDEDVGEHLDRQRGGDHHAGVVLDEVEGEQGEADHRDAGSDQCAGVGGEQPAVVGQAGGGGHAAAWRSAAGRPGLSPKTVT